MLYLKDIIAERQNQVTIFEQLQANVTQLRSEMLEVQEKLKILSPQN